MTQSKIPNPHPCGDCQYRGEVAVVTRIPGREVMLHICQFGGVLDGASGRCSFYERRIAQINSPTIERGEERFGFGIQIVIEADATGFHAYCPALKGLHTRGDTKEKALQNAKDAAMAYLMSLVKHGETIPMGILEEAGGHE